MQHHRSTFTLSIFQKITHKKTSWIRRGYSIEIEGVVHHIKIHPFCIFNHIILSQELRQVSTIGRFFMFHIYKDFYTFFNSNIHCVCMEHNKKSSSTILKRNTHWLNFLFIYSSFYSYVSGFFLSLYRIYMRESSAVAEKTNVSRFRF